MIIVDSRFHLGLLVMNILRWHDQRWHLPTRLVRKYKQGSSGKLRDVSWFRPSEYWLRHATKLFHSKTLKDLYVSASMYKLPSDLPFQSRDDAEKLEVCSICRILCFECLSRVSPDPEPPSPKADIA